MVGDGKGGTEVLIGSAVASREACFKLCVDKKRTSGSSINGATFGVLSGGRAGKCFCEFGMTSSTTSNGVSDWVSTKIKGNLYLQHCLYG